MVIAIDELRKRPIQKAWLIPIKIDECQIENRSIGAGETLLDLQYCDLTDWTNGLLKLLASLGVEAPITDLGVPLSKGVPSFVKIQNGFLRYKKIPGLPPQMSGIRVQVSSGWCQRNDQNQILAYLETEVPFEGWQETNRLLGLSGFYALSNDAALSEDPESPSTFNFEREHTLPAGLEVTNFQNGQLVRLPQEIKVISSFSAIGQIDGLNFTGSFEATLQFGTQKFPMNGVFELEFAPDIQSRPKSVQTPDQ